jgi:hypothetical protein
MGAAQIDTGRDLDVLPQFGKNAVWLFAQQSQQLRLNRRRDPADPAMAALLQPLGLTRAKTLRADLLRIVVTHRKPLRPLPVGCPPEYPSTEYDE